MRSSARSADEADVSVGPLLIRPKSRGTVTLTSASPFDAPLIDPNYLGEKVDLDTLVFGVRLCDKILHASTMGKHLGRSACPGLKKPIVECSDEEIGFYCRKTLETIYHPTSTCAMGPDGVVDHRNFKVRGFEGLRVVDASIMPRIVGGHPCAPVVAIAEKAADVFKSER